MHHRLKPEVCLVHLIELQIKLGVIKFIVPSELILLVEPTQQGRLDC